MDKQTMDKQSLGKASPSPSICRSIQFHTGAALFIIITQDWENSTLHEQIKNLYEQRALIIYLQGQ